ncbi:pH-response regulator protein palH/RIM21 [Erysiphe neolycopersici]|uniref:pH-response regulator protein palH/RIM21 n=1 Tax=Erysiphe neolycopersici TaxID=212602 RepID=A0A420HNN3_9PEZI|nr:pH-response regulator protein palH/RIM21 [Erysiphe neolycopersici]
MEARQLINIASKPSKPKSTVKPLCSAFTLPRNGVLTLNATTSITLSSDAIYQPFCNDSSSVLITESNTAGQIHFRDPFYASTLPECYALAATTVIAYMLVIMLIITPRRFLDDGVLVLGRGGFTNSPSGNENGFGIGRRPWLQKAAALTVAISLTIATADTFKVAEIQYNLGYMDAQALQKKVENGMELKIIRIISDTFLWLAQAQTLIRLFPRQREKVLIKWTAFALITLDELFSILNAFAYKGSSRPRSFVDAVPALAYLFQLALSLLYAAWVVYYSVTKKKFAFYHPQMKNICLVALLSLISILVPVVFFVTDISKPDLAGWGDYVRWVGAAAASVVVWEWVERIEALERNDKKDGVLGREVFDDDEIFDVSQSTDFTHGNIFPKISKLLNIHRKVERGVGYNSKRVFWPFISGNFSRCKRQKNPDIETGNSLTQSKCENIQIPYSSKKPLPVVMPINRADPQNAESTVYPVGYHTTSEDLPLTIDILRNPKPILSTSSEVLGQSSIVVDNQVLENRLVEEQIDGGNTSSSSQHWNARGPFTKIDTLKHMNQRDAENFIQSTLKNESSIQPQINTSTGGIRVRVESLISVQADKIREKKSRRGVSTNVLTKTIIPAPPRRTNLTATLLELEESERSIAPSSHIISSTGAQISNNKIHH